MELTVVEPAHLELSQVTWENTLRDCFQIRSDQDLWDPLTPMASSRHWSSRQGTWNALLLFPWEGFLCALQNPAHICRQFQGISRKEWFPLLSFYNSSLYAVITYLLALSPLWTGDFLKDRLLVYWSPVQPGAKHTAEKEDRELQGL